jgi:hypothetical protein
VIVSDGPALEPARFHFNPEGSMKKNHSPEIEVRLNSLSSDGLSIRIEKSGRILFESSEPMLRPLLLCLMQHGGEMEGSTIIDKIVGLAAAWLCVVGRVKEVITPMGSQRAQEALAAHGIELIASCIVPQIMNRDRTGPCPMEQLAMSFADPQEFYLEMRRRMEKTD